MVEPIIIFSLLHYKSCTFYYAVVRRLIMSSEAIPGLLRN